MLQPFLTSQGFLILIEHSTIFLTHRSQQFLSQLIIISSSISSSNINDDRKTKIKPRIISPQSFATFFPKLTSTQKPCESPSYSCIHYSISSKFITTIPWIIQIFWFRRSHSLEFLPLNPVTSPDYSCVLGFNRPSNSCRNAEFLALYLGAWLF